MVLTPFRRMQDQKTFSIFMLIVGMFVTMVTVPFTIKLGGITILNTILGSVLFLMGIIYFIDAYIQNG